MASRTQNTVVAALLCAGAAFLCQSACGQVPAKKMPSNDPAAFFLSSLRSPLKEERLVAVRKVGTFGAAGRSAIKDLGTILLRDKSTIAAEAAWSLAMIGPEAANELIAGLVHRDSPQEVRLNSARALGMIGPEAHQAVPHLVKALSDADPDLRKRAAWALGEMGAHAEPSVAKLCDRLLRDKSAEVREQACKALKSIGTHAVPELCRLLEDSDAKTQSETLEILSFLARESKDAQRRVIDALQHRDAAIRLQAAKHLTQLGCMGCMSENDRLATVQKLLPLLKEKNYPLQEHAFAAIVSFGNLDKGNVLEELAKINENHQWAIPFFLAQYGPNGRDAVEPLIKIVGNTNNDNRLGAIIALGQVGPDAAKAMPLLKTIAASDKDARIRTAAYVAISRIQGPDPAILMTQLTQLQLIEKIQKESRALQRELFIHEMQQHQLQTRIAASILIGQHPIYQAANRQHLWQSFNDAKLQARFRWAIELHVLTSTWQLPTHIPLPREMIQQLPPEAIPALLQEVTKIGMFGTGFV